jgi:outer membrane protein assembly factor BamB
MKRMRRGWTLPALAALLASGCGGGLTSEPTPPDGEARDAGVRDAFAPVDASSDTVIVVDVVTQPPIEAGDDATDSGCAPITPTGSTAVAYQIDPGHSGNQPGDHLSLPLCQRWSVDLGASVSYPLVAQGRVFVTVGGGTDAGDGVELVALDEHTGAIAWGPVALGGTVPMAHATYDDGRVFAINSDGQMSAFDAATGAPGWSVALAGGDAGDGDAGAAQFSSPPTALGGMVYVGSDETFYGVSESGGAVVWTAGIPTERSSPAVSATGVYASEYSTDPRCGTVEGLPFALAPATGQVIWQYVCEGFLVDPETAYPTVALFEEDLFVRTSTPFQMTGELLDATLGRLTIVPMAPFYDLGTYGTIPALSASMVFTLADVPTPTLSAIPIGSQTPQWTFTGDGALSSAPLLVGPHVVVGSTLGNVFVADAASGQLVSSAAIGAPIAAPDEFDNVILTGLAAADGMLFVPAGSRLVAY